MRLPNNANFHAGSIITNERSSPLAKLYFWFVHHLIHFVFIPLNPIENSEFIPFIISSIHRITFASYPNKAMFGKDFKGREVCKVVRKLLKICHGWLDPDKLNSFGDYGDGLKLKKPVLEREFPR